LEQNRWEGALFVAESRKTQTPREIDLSNDLDSLDTKEKENPYEDLLHDCYVTTEMINTVVMKPVEKEDLYVEDLDLSKILRGYDEYGYCVIQMQCLLSHQSHFMNIMNIRGRNYLVQSFFAQYKIKIQELEDVHEFLASTIQLCVEARGGLRSRSYL